MLNFLGLTTFIDMQAYKSAISDTVKFDLIHAKYLEEKRNSSKNFYCRLPTIYFN